MAEDRKVIGQAKGAFGLGTELKQGTARVLDLRRNKCQAEAGVGQQLLGWELALFWRTSIAFGFRLKFRM